MLIEIDGNEIQSEAAFHATLKRELDLSAYYGANLDALWDVLTTDVERPLVLVWRNAEQSRRICEQRFDAIVRILRNVERQDEEWGLAERFELRLA